MTADTLTALIPKVQAQLLDNGSLFTTPTVTAAMRQALADVNRAVPQNAAVLITAIADQKEYELTDADPAALQIFGVLLDGDSDSTTDLPYYAYNEDSRVFFRLRQPQAAGAQIIVHYTKPHTINGLDGALDSTLTDDLNSTIIDGACYYSCIIRSASTIETNNVQPNVAKTWSEAAAVWKRIFDTALKAYKRQGAPKGDPSSTAWNDSWHDESYPC